MDVVHAPERSRFELEQDGEPAVLSYTRSGDQVTFTHTLVPATLEGRGIGSRLATAAVGWARTEGLQIEPQCWFVRGWMERHPEPARR